MADMIVDGAKLDACNTAEANAIRAKTGSTDTIPYDYANNKGFADAIAAIPTGGGGTSLSLEGRIGLITDANVSGDVVLDFHALDLALGRCFQSSQKVSGTGETNLTVKCKSIVGVTNWPGRMNYFMYGSNAFDTVDFQCSEMDYIEPDNGMFYDCTSVKTITGTPFSLTGPFNTATVGYRPFNCRNLVDVRFYENLSAQTIYFLLAPALSDASLVSLANGLQVSEGSAVLNLHATPKTKLGSIYGYTESVTRGAETYDRFVADASGAVTLMDFITNTKGWTVA